MKRKTLIVLGIIFIIGAIAFGVVAFLSAYTPKRVVTETSAPMATAVPTPPPSPEAEPTPTPEPEETPEPTPEPTPYISPVDFDNLRAVNSDIYGWIEIADTNISLPIVQSATDDTFYLNHNSDRSYSANGSVFSESKYNKNDFSDPVTILYGHHMSSGAIFGYLQKYYSDATFFKEHPTFWIYTPTEGIECGVFAAVPYSSDHILYYNDFTDEKVFETFFDSVFNTRDLSAQFNEEYAPEPGDRVVILSTCLASNNTRRFLVMATLLD